jgi:bifunctional DNA-binding transcriptional regulator/antitoxin component of YhaV-PrlF toxin-antitoxin module
LTLFASATTIASAVSPKPGRDKERVMTSVAYLNRRGQLTIPAGIRRAAGLEPGQAFVIQMTRQGLVLREVEPEDIDPDQAWFWTPEWQAKEREADEDIAAGRVTLYLSDEEFLASLDE